MQAFKATIYLIGFLVWLTACTGTETTPIPPTPIVTIAAIEAVVPTPTLHSWDTAVLPQTQSPDLENKRSLGDPYIPELGNLGYDVQQYNLELAIDPAITSLTGTTTIQAVATSDALSQVSLDFIGFAIEQVRVNDDVTTFSRESGKLLVDLPQPSAAGTRFNLIIAYAGQPVRKRSDYVGFIDALGFQFVENKTVFVVAEPDGARYWFPANDHPRDKAFFRFELTVPAGLTAVANGHLVSTQPNEVTTTFIWEHLYPMAPYLALIAVGPYERIDAVSPGGVPLRHYVFADSRAEFEKAVAVTGEAIDWMSQLFGPYPFEEFGYVAAEVPGASLETQTMVLLSSSMTGQRTAVHEMAHMWFGNWVSLDSWQEMWRNEGFATYVTMMWENRGDPEGLELEVAGALAAVAENEPHYPLGNPPPENLFGYNTYFEGAGMIHALRQQVGDEAFFTGLRAYFQRYGGSVASDTEFQAVMEEAANVSLSGFFAEWLQ